MASSLLPTPLGRLQAPSVGLRHFQPVAGLSSNIFLAYSMKREDQSSGENQFSTETG